MVRHGLDGMEKGVLSAEEGGDVNNNPKQAARISVPSGSENGWIRGPENRRFQGQKSVDSRDRKA